jgi:hypothetical protein
MTALNLVLLAILVAIPAIGLRATTRWASRPARHVPRIRHVLMSMPLAAYFTWAASLLIGLAVDPGSRLWLLELGLAVTLWLGWSVLVSLGLTAVLLVRYHTERP